MEEDDGIPTTCISRKDLEAGIPIWKLFILSKLCKSHSEAIRMARQGGLYINNFRLKETDLNIILV